MKVYNKREMADEVLAHISKALATVDVEITLESYQNGREQGHAVIHYDDFRPLWLGFSENRNSDDVVVYEADHDPMQSVSEEAWKKAKFFKTPEKAGEYIVELLLKRVMKTRDQVKETA